MAIPMACTWYPQGLTGLFRLLSYSDGYSDGYCLLLLAFVCFCLLLLAFACFCLLLLLLLAFVCFCLLLLAFVCFCLLLLAFECFCLLLLAPLPLWDPLGSLPCLIGLGFLGFPELLGSPASLRSLVLPCLSVLGFLGSLGLSGLPWARENCNRSPLGEGVRGLNQTG